MKYKLCWLDATLEENGFPKNTRRTKYTPEFYQNDGWFDYMAEHTFEAKNDTQAKLYVKSYDFDYRNVDVFSVYNEKGERVFTEEDYWQ